MIEFHKLKPIGKMSIYLYTASGFCEVGLNVLPELPANLAWGDTDRRTLYITARSNIYRLRLAVPGAAVF